MSRKPNPLLTEFLDPSLPLPAIHWETVPPGVDPWSVWAGYDEGVEGWVPIWFPSYDAVTGRSYGEFERAHLFDRDLRRILGAMKKWPLWGGPRQKKHAVAIALLQLSFEVMNLCCRV
jgi:hypothetical protein